MIATILCQKLLMHPWIGNHLNVFMHFFVQATKCASIFEAAPRWHKPSTANSGKKGKRRENQTTKTIL
jgi:hypothetical protein